MFYYFILGISTLFLASCLPTTDCPKCQPTSPPVSPIAQKKLVKIGASDLNMPPYFITTEKIGLEQEIIEKAFLSKGYEPVIEYANNRKYKFFEQKFDCISSVTEQSGLPNFVKYSNPIVPYQDMAIYLGNRGFTIQSIDDLKGKKIEAFNNAEKLLNLPDIRKESNYREHGSKASQVLMLYHETVDVLLMDKKMFSFYQNKMYHKIRTIERQRKERAESNNQPYVEHPLAISVIFPEHFYKIACKNEQLVNDFNEGLKMLKQPNPNNPNGLSDYDVILNKPEYQAVTFPRAISSAKANN